MSISKWLWNSPTVTALFEKVSLPLRFLVLTPLVLTILSPLEIGVYYLLASAGFFVVFLGERLSGVFTLMLNYAYRGATNLSPILIGEKPRGTGDPNWEIYKVAFDVLRRLQFSIGVPGALVGILLLCFGVGRLTSWDFNMTALWAAVALTALGQVITMLMCHNSAALSSIEKVVILNRVGVLTNLVSLILSVLALIITKSILGIVVARLLVILAKQIILQKLVVSNLPNVFLSIRSEAQKRKEIYRQALKPLLKTSLGVVTGKGLISFVAIYVAGLTDSYGELFVASFLFTSSLLTNLVGLASTPLLAIRPMMSSHLVKGELEELKDLIIPRLWLVAAIMVSFVVGIGFLGNPVLDMIKSNVLLLDGSNWWVYSALFTLAFFLKRVGFVYNLTNQAKFAYRNSAAALIVVALLILYGESLTSFWFLVVVTLPQVLVIEFSPFRGLRALFRSSPLQGCA